MIGIRKIILGGFFWTILNQLGTTLLGLVVTGILARLITPKDYGIVAMVSLATGFLNVVKDFGFGAALVQKKEVTNEEFNTVFWLNFAIGCVLTVVVVITSPIIADFFAEPQVEDVTKALSFTFLINSVGIVWANKMIKDVAFKQIFFRSICSVVIAGIAAILLAYKGWGIWALVTQTYVTLIVNTVLNYLQVKWVPTWSFHPQYLRSLFKFGGPLLIDQSINYWVRNIDNLLVGKYLGRDNLAYYNRAYNLMLLPVKQLSGTLTKVLFPSLSLIQDDTTKVSEIYLKISGVIAFIAFPLMIGLSFEAEALIRIVYGDQWLAAVPIFKVLSLLGMFQALGTLSGNVYLSQGKTKLMFRLGLFSRGIMILGICLGLFLYGMMGMVYGYCISSGIAFLPELYFVGRVIGIKLKNILLNFLPYLVIAIVSAVIVFIVLTVPGMGVVITFIVKMTLMTAIYLVLNLVIKTQALNDLLQLAKNIVRKKG